MKYNWNEIEFEYVSSQTTLQELSEKYEVPFDYIQKKSAELNWSAKRKDVASRVFKNQMSELIATLSNKSADKIRKNLELVDTLKDMFIDSIDAVNVNNIKDLLALLQYENETLRNLTGSIESEKENESTKIEIMEYVVFTNRPELEPMFDYDIQEINAKNYIEVIQSKENGHWYAKKRLN